MKIRDIDVEYILLFIGSNILHVVYIWCCYYWCSSVFNVIYL